MAEGQGGSGYRVPQGTDAGSTQELWNRFRNLDILANKQLDEATLSEVKFVLKAIVRFSITKEYAEKLKDLADFLNSRGVYNVGWPKNHAEHLLLYSQQLLNELKGLEAYGDQVFAILVETGQIAVREPEVARG